MSQNLRNAQTAFLRLLARPVVRFCLRHCFTIQDLSEAIKRVFVDVAREEVSRENKRVNVSRLSVMTGLHRRDVMRLLEEESEPEGSGGIVSRVIGQWENDPRFKTKTGKPRALSCEGERSEFRKLVALVSTDLHPGTVLFELKRLGIVEVEDGEVQLKRRHFVSRQDPVKGYELLAKDCDDLVLAVDENLNSPESRNEKSIPNLHGRTEFDNVSKQDLPIIRKWLLKEGSDFHKRVRKFVSRYDLDIHPSPNKKGGAKVVVGAFSRTVFPEENK